MVFLDFFRDWFNLLGLVTVLGAINVGTYYFFMGSLGTPYLGLEDSTAVRIVFLAIITGLQALVNHMGIGLTAKLKAYMLQDDGVDTVEANHRLGFKADQRDYMVGLQILKDLDLSEIRLLTNNPKKVDPFIKNAMDLRVVEQIPIIAPPEQHRARYMRTKKEKMGHLLPDEG